MQIRFFPHSHPEANLPTLFLDKAAGKWGNLNVRDNVNPNLLQHRIVYFMTAEGKPKVPPIEAIRFWPASNRVLLEPDDFIDLVTGKDLIIVRGKLALGFGRWRYIYWALDEPITYATITKEELPGIKVDVVTKKAQHSW